MILYPYEFNTSSGYGNNELWSKGNTGNAFNDNTIHKTIYSYKDFFNLIKYLPKLIQGC